MEGLDEASKITDRGHRHGWFARSERCSEAGDLAVTSEV